MDSRLRARRDRGFSLLEVLVALVLLGLVTAIFMYTSNTSRKNTGRSVDWQAESVAIERAIELLRTGHTLAKLQDDFDSTWVDNSSRLNIEVHAEGDFPDAALCQRFGVDPKRLAKITITAQRQSASEKISITTYLWVN